MSFYRAGNYRAGNARRPKMLPYEGGYFDFLSASANAGFTRLGDSFSRFCGRAAAPPGAAVVVAMPGVVLATITGKMSFGQIEPCATVSRLDR